MKIYSNNILYNTILNISNNDNFDKNFLYHYLFIISHIRTYPYINRKYSKGDFIPVNMKTLRKLISYDYANIFIDNLVSAGILECDNFIEIRKKSRGFRINKKYLSEKFNLIDIKDVRLREKLQKNLLKDKYELLKGSDSYQFVTECMEHVDIDVESCNNYTDNFVPDANKAEYYKTATEIFDVKFAVKDKTAERLHNNLTNLPTQLRKFTSYKGQKLSQIDLKNSQPLFLYTLLSKMSIDDKELLKYKTVVTEIGFYEFFAEKLKYNLTAENRKEFKQNIFGGVLFNSNKTNLSEYEKIFKDEFPEIFYVIRYIKSKKYQDVAIMLQREESRFIFNCVDKIVWETKKRIPLLTIHDSICTTFGNEQTVYDIMKNEFEKNYNICPKLIVEKFV